MSKKIFASLFILVIVAVVAIFLFNRSYIKQYMPDNEATMDLPFATLVYDETMNKKALAEFTSYAEHGFKKTEAYLAVDPPIPTIYLPINTMGISTTYPDQNTIAYYYSDKGVAPVIHEYIHLCLGIYEEFWFTEGYAVYLSRKLKQRDDLLKRKLDVTDYWFINAKDKLGAQSEDEFFIDDITEERDKASFASFFDIGVKKPIFFENQGDRKAYYRVSSAFCNYLALQLGEETLLQLAKESNAIFESASKSNIDLTQHYNEWVDQLY